MNISTSTKTIETTRQTQNDAAAAAVEKQTPVCDKNSTDMQEEKNSQDSDFKKLLEGRSKQVKNIQPIRQHQ